MASRLEIFGAAQAAIRRTSGLPVTYSRGDDTVTVQAVKGKTVHTEQTASGAIETDEGVDWLVAVSDLILSGTATTPQPGDLIAVAEATGLGQYEVMPVGNGPCFTDSGSPGTQYRIHTRKVGLVPSE